MPKPTVSTTFNAVNKMKGPLAKMSQSIKRFSKIAIAGAGVALAAVAVGVNKFAEAGDEVAKTARKLGLSVEALQELRFAADRSGVSGEAFSEAMKKLNKNVGDLRVGTGLLTTFLNKQNPALAEQLKNVESNEEAFALLTEEISNTESPFDKAALAQAAFGRAGQDLIVMLENGTEGIEDLREEAKKYGNIISTEAAASSEKFIDSLTNMKAAGLALRNKALGPLVEKLQPLIQRMADFVAANQELINQKIDTIFTNIGNTISTLTGLWNSGLIPALLAGVATFKILTATFAAYKAIIVGVKAIQITYTTALAVQTAATGTATTAAALFNAVLAANPVGAIIIAVTALIALFVLLEKKYKIFTRARDAIKGTAPSEDTRRLGRGGRGALMGRNDNVVKSQSTVTNRSQLAVTFAGTPPGTTMKQTGSAPAFTLNNGFGQGGL